MAERGDLAGRGAGHRDEQPAALYRYLPFWLASIFDRIGVVLPIAAIVLSIARYAPPAYSWFIQNRINRCYGELRYLEDELDRAGAEGDRSDFARRLHEIEDRVASLSTPVSYSPRLYTLRAHIELVRSKLNRSGAGTDATRNLPSASLVAGVDGD